MYNDQIDKTSIFERKKSISLILTSKYTYVVYIYPIFNIWIAYKSFFGISGGKSGGSACTSFYNQIAREQRMKYRASTWRESYLVFLQLACSFFSPFPLLPLPLLCLNSPFVVGREHRPSGTLPRPFSRRSAARPLYIIIKSSLCPGFLPARSRRHANRIKPE